MWIVADSCRGVIVRHVRSIIAGFLDVHLFCSKWSAIVSHVWHIRSITPRLYPFHMCVALPPPIREPSRIAGSTVAQVVIDHTLPGIILRWNEQVIIVLGHACYQLIVILGHRLYFEVGFHICIGFLDV